MKKIKETGKYICWAACTAMALNKIQPNNQSIDLSARDVYDAVDVNMNNFDCDYGCSYPDGCIECVKYSYSSFGYTCNNRVSTPISGSEMCHYISNQKPVQINISTHSDPSASGSKEHAVIVEKVTLNQNSVVYSIVDPSRKYNPRHEVMVSVSPAIVSSSFNYTGYDADNSTLNYRYWYRTYR